MDLTRQRVLWSDNGTLNDISTIVNDYQSQTQVIPFVAAEDYLYIGSDAPFNNKHFEISVVNAETSAMTIEIWNGDNWHSAVDLLDGTAVSGASLAQSGILRWVTNREEHWSRELDSEDVSGLSGTFIYNMYWIRISFSADLTAGFALKYVGQRFSSDSDLYQYYPDLNNSDLKISFAAGKTDWIDESFAAALQIQRDLVSRNIVWTPNQVLNYELFTEASVHKMAEIIYSAFGDTYVEYKSRAAIAYKDALNVGRFQIDRNADANISRSEKRFRSGRLHR